MAGNDATEHSAFLKTAYGVELEENEILFLSDMLMSPSMATKMMAVRGEALTLPMLSTFLHSTVQLVKDDSKGWMKVISACVNGYREPIPPFCLSLSLKGTPQERLQMTTISALITHIVERYCPIIGSGREQYRWIGGDPGMVGFIGNNPSSLMMQPVLVLIEPAAGTRVDELLHHHLTELQNLWAMEKK